MIYQSFNDPRYNFIGNPGNNVDDEEQATNKAYLTQRSSGNIPMLRSKVAHLPLSILSSQLSHSTGQDRKSFSLM